MSEVTNQRRQKTRKDIIKDIAIAFLTILLLLTFFSNTIMNYSLPEVAIQQINSGSISPMIRGTGTVEAESPYNVKVTQERVIQSVAVAEGDHVEKGDILYNLEDKESTELTDAKTKLEELTQAYETSLFSGDLKDETITRIRQGKTTTFDQYQAKLKEATDRYNAAKDADLAVQAQIDELTQSQAYTAAQYNYDEATPSYTDAEITYRLAELGELIEEATNSQTSAKERMDELKTAHPSNYQKNKNYQQASLQYETASAQIDQFNDEKTQLEIAQASNTKDTSQVTTQAGQVDNDFTRQLASLQDTKNKTAAELEDATNDRTELLTEIGKEIELCNQRDDIAEQQKTVDKLVAESTGGKIEAPVAGTVTSLALKAGESTNPEEAVAVIQVDGKDMVTSFSVTIDQAKNLKVGDPAEPQNAWYYTDFKATLKSITTDTQNPNTKKLLTFVIKSPEVQAGQSVSLQIGQKSEEYDLTVPAGAIRTDSNGKFILIVKSKSSPLGNRYIATRVDVEVVASDDTTAAITGSLEGDEYVITTATNPVNAGNQVRLANNQ
ncbi:efflux RND transporter periplasmic adaptor subunit [Butyrivibrio sp. NC2002]|uniref:efflux RND transporter periplasmic adaptor subunit n=1 Tax=Butyrivibrio sp. NC2002 TaxID=1410610 RepID=UPI0005634A4A|nr:HlyD family efflux transporter periplasmic adaptor subunit [Butyrivibrio sp. NC2002]